MFFLNFLSFLVDQEEHLTLHTIIWENSVNQYFKISAIPWPVRSSWCARCLGSGRTGGCRSAWGAGCHGLCRRTRQRLGVIRMIHPSLSIVAIYLQFIHLVIYTFTFHWSWLIPKHHNQNGILLYGIQIYNFYYRLVQEYHFSQSTKATAVYRPWKFTPSTVNGWVCHVIKKKLIALPCFCSMISTVTTCRVPSLVKCGTHS